MPQPTKIFAEINGTKYYGNDFYYLTSRFSSIEDRTPKAPVLDYSTSIKYRKEYLKSEVSDVTLQEGDEIYVAPDCAVSKDLLRKHYKLKKTPDAGKYNIVSGCDFQGNSMYCSKIGISKDGKTLVGLEYGFALSAALQWVSAHLGIEMLFLNLNKNLHTCTKMTDFHQMFLLGQLKKPLVFTDAIKLSSREFGIDDVKMLHETLSASYSEDNMHKAMLEMRAVLHTNYYDYPATMCYIARLCTDSSCYNYLRKHKSIIPKDVLSVFSMVNDCATPKTYDDWELTKNWIQSRMHITDAPIYTTIKSMNGKLYAADIDSYMFNEFYDNKLLLIPKKNPFSQTNP